MTGEAVLFIHSTGSGPYLWSTVPEDLGPSRKLRPANLGYPPNPLAVRGAVMGARDDALHLLEQIPADVERVHLVAHSYGALVALHLEAAMAARRRLAVASFFAYEPVMFAALAKADPEVVDREAVVEARTFLDHPWFLRDAEKGGREEWLEAFIDYWNRPGAWARMPESLRDATRAVGWKMFQEVQSCFFDDLGFDAWRSDAPVTVVRGSRSPRTSRAMAAGLASGIPNAVLVDVERTGHMAPITHPGIVHAELRGHFERAALGACGVPLESRSAS